MFQGAHVKQRLQILRETEEKERISKGNIHSHKSFDARGRVGVHLPALTGVLGRGRRSGLAVPLSGGPTQGEQMRRGVPGSASTWSRLTRLESPSRLGWPCGGSGLGANGTSAPRAAQAFLLVPGVGVGLSLFHTGTFFILIIVFFDS